MSGSRLSDYLDHMQRAAEDACSFVEGIAKDGFLADKRTQQAVVMSLVIPDEAATMGTTATSAGPAWTSCRRTATGATPSASIPRNHPQVQLRLPADLRRRRHDEPLRGAAAGSVEYNSEEAGAV